MKISLYELLATVSYGGIQTTYWETAKRLYAMGHEVHLYGGEGTIRGDVPPGVEILTFPFTDRSRFPDFGSRFRKFAERASFGRYTLDSLLRNRYDIIYIRKPYEMPISLYVRRKTGARVVYRSGGTEFYPGYARMARRIDAFLSCSAYNASQIESYCGIRPGVLHNGVDTERFRPVPKDAAFARRLGLSPDDFVLMSVGRLVGWKGYQYGIRAIARLGDPRVRYVIVGDGEYRGTLEREAREAGMGDRIVFAGFVGSREMPGCYTVADAVLFPTIGDDDAFPNTLCEAMACGKPAIGTMRGGIPEGIEDGVTGFLVPSGDADAIAGKVAILLEDRERAVRMGAAARELAERSFSWDVIVAKLAQRFEELMRMRRKG